MIPPTVINPDSVILQGTSLEKRRDSHTRYVNNFNVWKKQSLTKIGLAKWKSSRNKLPWYQEGKLQRHYQRSRVFLSVLRF